MTFYCTSGHGGLHLDKERCDTFYATLPRFFTYCKQTDWFEEDCDICAPLLVFYEKFEPGRIRVAYRGARSQRPNDGGALTQSLSEIGWNDLNDWLNDSPAGRHIVQIVQGWERQHASDWERGSACTSGTGWDVWMSRVGDGQQMRVTFARYPAQHLYSAQDMTAFIDGTHPEQRARAKSYLHLVNDIADREVMERLWESLNPAERRHVQELLGSASMTFYPEGWPKCPSCGQPALDGHITCGNVTCDEAGHRATSKS